MHFASPLSLWLSAFLVLAAGGVAWFSYRRPVAPLSRPQRSLLIALRFIALTALIVLICRPILLVPARQGDVVVPVLLDVSRSMRLTDADGASRLDRATDIVRSLLPALSQRFATEIYSVGAAFAPLQSDRLAEVRAEAPRSDLSGALDAIRERYRGRRLAGMVLISDGGDTTPPSPSSSSPGSRMLDVPVFAIGVGQPAGLPDREIVAVTAGEQGLDQASIDLHVVAASRGLGRQPFELTVRANGQVIETRRVEPQADGSPLELTFTVAPDSAAPTVFTVDAAGVPGSPEESIRENNSRSVMVSPAGRKRRVLLLAGAPGFDHSFLLRALARDPGLDIDSVVRKGKNDDGRDTYVVQAEGGRAAKLAQGLPARKEDLFAYDGLILANVEADSLTRAQLTLATEFVGERGGGLLVFGGRSFAQHGLIGTPLEAVLPVELSDRRGAAGRSSYGADRPSRLHGVALTPEGALHPVMRIGSNPEEARQRWAALPALSSSAALGAPRPGASVLAVAAEPAGMYPVVAVQRYGRGRSLVFGGEASWRWRMLTPAPDRSYEYFWRQSVRWLTTSAPDPVDVTLPESPESGMTTTIRIDARDAAFAAVSDAVVDASLVKPNGDREMLSLRRESGGGFATTAALEQPGLYRVQAEARLGENSLGTADRWFYVGNDSEFSDPRLNEGVLRRLARSSGGRYVGAADASRVAGWLSDQIPATDEAEQRDLWHQPWILGILMAVLAVEWMLRRRWGLR